MADRAGSVVGAGTPGQWWLFTHYPELNDAFTWLDGGLLLTYIGATALVVGGWIWLCLRLAGALAGTAPGRHLTMTLIPFAGASIFVGLSLLTTGQAVRRGHRAALGRASPAQTTRTRSGRLIWSVSLAWRWHRPAVGAGRGGRCRLAANAATVGLVPAIFRLVNNMFPAPFATHWRWTDYVPHAPPWPVLCLARRVVGTCCPTKPT